MRNTRYHYYIIILLFIAPFFLNAQNHSPHYVAFTTEDGLPSNRVYDIMQDSKGYIWGATDNGLVKFNGRVFKEYTTVESINSEYTYLHELKDGSIWCINFGNQVFQVSGDSLKVVEAFLPYINDPKYFTLHKWRDSILYLTNHSRIVEYDVFNQKIKEIDTNDHPMISNFCRDEESIFYSSGNGGIQRQNYKLRLSDQSISVANKHKYPEWIKIFFNNDISFLHTSIKKNNSSGYLFPFDPSSPNILNKDENILELKNSYPNKINSITQEGNDTWVSSVNGSFHLPSKKCFFPNHFITRVIKDVEGNYWVSTYHSGIFFIPNLHLSHNDQFNKGIHQIEYLNDTELLLSSIDGYVYVYNTKEKEIKQSAFISRPSTVRLPLLDDNKKLFVHTTRPASILNLDDGRFTTVRPEGIAIKNFSLIEKNVLLIQSAKSYLSIYNINASVDQTKPSILLSDRWAASQFYWDDLGVLRFSASPFKDVPESIENIHYEKKAKRIWIAYTNKTFVEQNQVFGNFTDSDNENLKLNYITDHMDGGVVAAERTHGLVFIKDKQIVSRTKHDIYKEFGSIRDIIMADSLIVCLSNKGIIITDKNGVPLHTLDETDGLKGSSINDIQYHSGQLWIGTSKGLYHIPIHSFRDNTQIPEVIISHVLVNDKHLDSPFINNLKFPNNSDVEIHFEAVCFKGRNVFRYQYKLHQDEDWKTLLPSSSPIRFPNLASGHYKFQIKVVNEEGITGETATMDFRVLPPLWFRWWFILGLVVLIGMILFFYNKMNLERIARENQLEKELIERKNQFDQEIRANKLSALQSRMNPHFIFNSLNSIQDFIIKLDKEGANEYLGIFSDLMRVYLNHSEKDSVELTEELESLQLYLELEKLRFNDIGINFHVDKELKYMDVHIPPLFIQPYIENAFKHGLLHKKSDKHLDVAFKLIQNRLIIQIKDNGVGREKVREIQNKTTINGLSYSTKANQTRLELLNYNRAEKIVVNIIDLYDNNRPSGTLVEINIPL